ncbi:MAG: 50S ribosomal protein L13, partial [Firmicutes bacterium]|nr:50S ribosomal protein L13 [Bacillota bacterium]
VDCGDFVIIVNAQQAVLTGKKLEQKYYRTHSGYVGGLHETQYKHLMESKPEFAMRLAVRGMLQKNSIAKWQLRRLKVFRGPEHKHQAQKPEVWDR